MTWWHYLLLVNLYLLLFYGFYAALLRNETFFQLNRVYLVAGALLSFIIPVIQADWIKQLFITQRVQQTIYSTIYHPEVVYQAQAAPGYTFTIGQIFAIIYIGGAIFLLGRFFFQLLAVKKLIANLESAAAFSFFNKVKIDDALPGQQTIIDHEEVHVKQWHSADVLLIEAVMIINWFNPIVYFYRKAIKHVHEYIADKKAIERGTSKSEYAYLLLSQTLGVNPHQLTNNFFNKSLLKQRIIMLNKDESRRRVLLKYGLSAPLFAAMLIFSSATVKDSAVIQIINRKTEQIFSVNTLSGQRPDSEQVAFVNKMLNEVDIASPKKASPEDINVDSVIEAPAPQAVPEIKIDGKATADNTVFTAVEMQPDFPGGQPALSKFLQTNLRYPALARQNGVQGRVYIQFVVQKDGSLDDLKVLREPGSGLGDEAMRVLASSPKWNPGIQNGHPVKVQFTIPVAFFLNTDASPKADTLRKVLSFVNKVRLNGYTMSTGPKRDSVITVIGHPAKTVMMGTMYFNHNGDSSKVIYTINGKEVPEEKIKNLKPEMIETVRVLSSQDAANNDKLKKPTISILLKDTRSDHQ